MEEILASIRRIIADEDTGPAAASKLASVAAKAAPEVSVSEDELDKLFDAGDDDVLDLDLDDSDHADEPMSFGGPDADLAFEPAPVAEPVKVPPPPPRVEPVRAAAPPPERPKPAPRVQPEPVAFVPDAPVEALLSQSTDTMVSAAFDNLALTILNKNARTVEDLIQDMLRPMLRSWLDQNLPALVERLVRAEIERVARGR